MIRRHLMVLRLALMAVDGLTATVVFALVSLARFGDGDAAELWAADRDRRPSRGGPVRDRLGRGALVRRAVPAARPVAPAERGPGHRPGDAARAGPDDGGAVPVQAAERQPALPRPPVRHPAAGHPGGAHLPPLRLQLHAAPGLQHPVHARRRDREARPGLRRPGRGSTGPGAPGHRPPVGAGRARRRRLAAGPRDAGRHRSDLPLLGRRRGRDLPAGHAPPPTWSRSAGWPPTRARPSGSRSSPTGTGCRASGRRSSTASSCGPWSATSSTSWGSSSSG